MCTTVIRNFGPLTLAGTTLPIALNCRYRNNVIKVSLCHWAESAFPTLLGGDLVAVEVISLNDCWASRSIQKRVIKIEYYTGNQLRSHPDLMGNRQSYHST